MVDAGHGEVADAASEVGPHCLDGVQVRGVGRQPDHGQPVPSIDHVPDGDADVGVQVVPDQHDRAAELLGGIQQAT